MGYHPPAPHTRGRVSYNDLLYKSTRQECGIYRKGQERKDIDKGKRQAKKFISYASKNPPQPDLILATRLMR
jgi:hypothetical protein